MYTLVRRYIKTAIGFLMLGLGIGVWMIVRRELWHRAPGAYEVSAHTHAVVVGFVMMMILGVALWLFPRPEKNDRRYRPAWIGVAYWVLVIGTGGRVAGELFRSATSAGWLSWVIVVSGVCQAAGIALFFFTMWPRIRSTGSHVREAQGERF